MHLIHFSGHPQLIEKHSAELVGSLEKLIAKPELQTERAVVKLVGWIEMPVAMLAEWPEMHSAQLVGSCPHSEVQGKHFEDVAPVDL